MVSPSRSLLFGCTLPALVAVGCRDVVQAATEGPPPPPPAYVTLTLDTLTGPFLDVGNQWGGVSLLLGADQSVHVVAFDAWNDRLRYYGCANVCDDRVHWFDGTADSVWLNYANGLEPGSGVVLTSSGFHAVYTRASPYGDGIGYAHCAGACNLTANWAASTMLPDSGLLEGVWPGPPYGTPLAADGAGALHLVYLSVGDNRVRYAYCASACGDRANWGGAPVGGPVNDAYHNASRLIAVAPSGAVHLLYATASSLMHAVCVGACTDSTSWTEESVSGVAQVDPLRAISLVFDQGGDAQVALADQSGAVRYGTCAAPCRVPGTWSFTALPLTTVDVALAPDGLGGVYLATNDGTVALSHCASGCLDPTAWQTVTVDSALGNGRVAITVDSAGHARIASSYSGAGGPMRYGPQILQYTRMLR
jgi:hypothetical protein